MLSDIGYDYDNCNTFTNTIGAVSSIIGYYKNHRITLHCFAKNCSNKFFDEISHSQTFGLNTLFIGCHKLEFPLTCTFISSLSLNHHLYADDTQLFFSIHPRNFDSSINHLQTALQQISSWMSTNLIVNSSKIEFLIIGLKS